jgi:hypothetical protein
MLYIPVSVIPGLDRRVVTFYKPASRKDDINFHSGFEVYYVDRRRLDIMSRLMRMYYDNSRFLDIEGHVLMALYCRYTESKREINGIYRFLKSLSMNDNPFLIDSILDRIGLNRKITITKGEEILIYPYRLAGVSDIAAYSLSLDNDKEPETSRVEIPLHPVGPQFIIPARDWT